MESTRGNDFSPASGWILSSEFGHSTQEWRYLGDYRAHLTQLIKHSTRLAGSFDFDQFLEAAPGQRMEYGIAFEG